MKPKSETIDAIIRINPSASPAFLAEFSSRELDEYLGRLRHGRDRRPPCERTPRRRGRIAVAEAAHHAG